MELSISNSLNILQDLTVQSSNNITTNANNIGFTSATNFNIDASNVNINSQDLITINSPKLTFITSKMKLSISNSLNILQDLIIDSSNNITTNASNIRFNAATNFNIDASNVNINSDVIIQNDLTIIGAINMPSDRNLKNNIENISETKCNNILNLKPVVFELNNDKNKEKHYGLIAQDVEELYPELVKATYKEYKTINYIELIPLLISQIQEMKKEIDYLKMNK